MRPLAWGGAAALLLAPWVAMRFTSEVAWTGSDFAVFGAMLLAGCAAFELAARAARTPAYLGASVIALGAAFLLVWANLAVGIIGEPSHPLNLAFMAIPLAGVAGALLSHRRARGMARTLRVMAGLQIVAGGLALQTATQEPRAFLLGFTAAYVAVWLLCAVLFRAAADTAPR
ncbi:hypothetical protein [Pseudoxanthomonas sp. Root630]|uniref:hypothetical protein n=1 Tax=Pseudoxanthomonas sp. Root630 TaxID=1736574 RepID=UPI000702F29F|nr:hypothetical protein [Pseudoxanthomonas sp. Root630]KRA42458.1 hypothetical protein ASD72_14295 [Pseudoxanthomonas sp. Root630]